MVFLFGNVTYCFYIYGTMIELIEEYQNKGHDVCFMITCAGNYVFEHYVDGELVFDVVTNEGDDKEIFKFYVDNYLCELKDTN